MLSGKSSQIQQPLLSKDQAQPQSSSVIDQTEVQNEIISHVEAPTTNSQAIPFTQGKIKQYDFDINSTQQIETVIQNAEKLGKPSRVQFVQKNTKMLYWQGSFNQGMYFGLRELSTESIIQKAQVPDQFLNNRFIVLNDGQIVVMISKYTLYFYSLNEIFNPENTLDSEKKTWNAKFFKKVEFQLDSNLEMSDFRVIDNLIFFSISFQVKISECGYMSYDTFQIGYKWDLDFKDYSQIQDPIESIALQLSSKDKSFINNSRFLKLYDYDTQNTTLFEIKNIINQRSRQTEMKECEFEIKDLPENFKLQYAQLYEKSQILYLFGAITNKSNKNSKQVTLLMVDIISFKIVNLLTLNGVTSEITDLVITDESMNHYILTSDSIYQIYPYYSSSNVVDKFAVPKKYLPFIKVKEEDSGPSSFELQYDQIVLFKNTNEDCDSFQKQGILHCTNKLQ
eukprot:403349887